MDFKFFILGVVVFSLVGLYASCYVLLAGQTAGSTGGLGGGGQVNETDYTLGDLSEMGYVVYGFSEIESPVWGETMTVSMRIVNESSLVKQVYDGFDVMHRENDGKDYYFVEILDEVGVWFFVTKGDDIRDFMGGRINGLGWYERNLNTTQEFYRWYNETVDEAEFVSSVANRIIF